MKTFQTVLVEQREYTSLVTINKPASLNALDTQTITELCEVIQLLENDPETKGIIFTGSGDKAFIAGADIKEFVGLDVQDATEKAKNGHKLMDRLATFGKPIVAAVNGFALGGGLELAMACHIRVASENAKLGLPEVSLGIIPGYGGTQRLPQLVGRGKALEMILTGEMIEAKDALQWGLVNYVVERDELLNCCTSILEKIYIRSSDAVSSAIKAVNVGLLHPAEGMASEIALFAESFAGKDSQEGVQAFVERRKPKF